MGVSLTLKEGNKGYGCKPYIMEGYRVQEG